MPISTFNEKFIIKLRLDRIPENISKEMDFERGFVLPKADESVETESDVWLFSHPWKKSECCEPNCESALRGVGHRERGCEKCWAASKSWASVEAFGTHNNFDLVGKDAKGAIVAVEIKLVKVKEGRMPNGEIQRFLGQCALAASKFDFVIGICGYHGTLNPKYNLDTERFTQWAEKHNIALIFRSVSGERYGNYEIELIAIPSFKFKRFSQGEDFNYNDRHGVELHYKDEKQRLLVGFIEGYQWYHIKRGPVKIYMLTQDSREWGELLPESKHILNELKEAIHEVLNKQPFDGMIKGNIYSWPNA
jgi:hypothetical protein